MSDIEAISQLVNWERQTRVRYLDQENLATYWPDATVTTADQLARLLVNNPLILIARYRL